VNRKRFVTDRAPAWGELDALVAAAGRRASRLEPVEVRRLGLLYRAAAADLALARRCFPADPLVSALERRVVSARRLVYGGEHQPLSLGRFLGTRYWQRVRERPALLLAAFLLLAVPMLLAGTWAGRDPDRAGGLVPESMQQVTTRTSADFGLPADERAAASSQILVNNIRVTFLAFAGGIAFAVGAALVLLYNGILLGTAFGLTIAAGNGPALFEFVLPHGVLELSCIVVAGAAGMRMGWALVAPGRRHRGDALKIEARAAVEVIAGTALALVVAGIVEGTFSTTGLGLGPALVVGLGLGAVFWILVWWRGAPDDLPARGDDEVLGTASGFGRGRRLGGGDGPRPDGAAVPSPAVRPLDALAVRGAPAP